mmetsp:Transcript_26651/g.64183  ORF Transcript_26651/g.64183 Transcript_26651/m.64183 type:complete len:349 (+) Transcript_26651:1660-2706(+)
MQCGNLRICTGCRRLQGIHKLLHPLQLSCLRLDLRCQRHRLPFQVELRRLQPRDPLSHGSVLVTACAPSFQAGDTLLQGLQLGNRQGVQPSAEAGDLLMGGLGLRDCTCNLSPEVISVQGCYLGCQPLELPCGRRPGFQLAHSIGQGHQCALSQPHAPLRHRRRRAGLLRRSSHLLSQALRLIPRGLGLRRPVFHRFDALHHCKYHLVCGCGVALEDGHTGHQVVHTCVLQGKLFLTSSQVLVHKGVDLRQPGACFGHRVVQWGKACQLLREAIDLAFRGIHGLRKLCSQTGCLLLKVFGGIFHPLAGGGPSCGFGDTVFKFAELLVQVAQLSCCFLSCRPEIPGSGL